MYSIDYHKETTRDFKELGHSTTILVLKKIQKIAKNPTVGEGLLKNLCQPDIIRI